MPKLFQIFEDDLAELERVLPQIAEPPLTPILAEAGEEFGSPRRFGDARP